MPAFATVQELLDRLDERYATELTESTPGEGTDEDRVSRALDDGAAELQGWIDRLPATRKPGPDTLRIHNIKVAVYLLTLDRPGKEFEQIRNAYVDTIDFYKSLEVAAQQNSASPLGVSSCAPDPVFTDDSLKGLVP